MEFAESEWSADDLGQRQGGNPSLSAELSPDGKAKEWPLYDLANKQVMVLDEFDIHPAKGVRSKDRGLGEDLLPDQVLYALTGSGYLSLTAFLRRQWGF